MRRRRRTQIYLSGNPVILELLSRDEVVCGGADGGDDLRLVCGQRHGDDTNMVFPARVKSMV